MSIQSYRSLEIGITDLIFLFGPGPNKKIGPDRMVTETVKGPFSWTDGLGPVRSTRSVGLCGTLFLVNREPRQATVQITGINFGENKYQNVLGYRCKMGNLIEIEGK